MAFDDTFTSHPYESSKIVQPGCRYFPTDILVKHWQLRNLISSDEPRIITYASVSKLYQLDLNTHKHTLIVDLGKISENEFIPRCIASGFGWICAGGEEEGLIAIVNVNVPASDAAEVDQQLPIDFARRPENPSRPPTVRLDRVGASIINSIAIYKIKGNTKLGIQDDVVAVLTNNDKTVRILSLSEGIETAVLDVSFPVNHATISPDGQVLVAVGDHQQAYFFEKIVLDPHESKISTAKYASSHCRWVLLNIVKLHVPRQAGISGYFSTAWSASGALCAVASENGYVTLLDVQKIKAEEVGEDAIITVVSSTRPDTEPGPGSIRTLLFSPQPWNLLIWSEGRERVCVADLRYNLNARQILKLRTDQPNMSEIVVETAKGVEPAAVRSSDYDAAPGAAQFMRRLRQQRESMVIESSSNSDDRSPRSGSRRRVVRLLRSGESDSPERRDADQNMDGLDFDERMILEVLRTAAHTTDTSAAPRSIRYRAQDPRQSQDSGENGSRTNDREDNMREALNIALRRHRGEGELFHPHSLPRRQASIVISNEEGQPSSPFSRTWGELRAELLPPTENRSQLRSRTSAERTWALPGELPGEIRTRRQQRNADEDNVALRSDRRLQRAKEREQRLREIYALSHNDQHLLRLSALRNREDGPESAGMLTAGLVISPDGKTLWAGSQKGIFEFKLNMLDLMNYPGLEVR
jgi:WD40 repeat protein